MNSELVEYTRISPNHSGQRTHAIDRITPHCVVGQLDGPTLGEWFSRPSTQASCNYAIDRDGRVCLIVDEGNRSWCSSSNANDQQAVTIECASDRTSPYAFTDRVYQTLVDLCVDICKRHGKDKLLWIPDSRQALAYEPKTDEMLLTVHRWFSSTDCPGEWMMGHMADLASRVTERCQTLPADDAVDGDRPVQAMQPVGRQGSDLLGMTNAGVVEVLGELAKEDAKSSGILASLTTAQAILESGYCRSELAVQANNLFGMKARLSGNTWDGSAWDGVSVYSKLTMEYYSNGYVEDVHADFRRYDNLDQSMADHSAYLLGARNGDGPRYAGLAGETDFDKAANILLTGGYATDPAYPAKLRKLYDDWSLGKLDGHAMSAPRSQAEEKVRVPFMVKVSIDDLRIRSGPGTQYDFRQYIPKGIFTIVEVRGNWGRLKSDAGWICLDYAKRLV